MKQAAIGETTIFLALTSLLLIAVLAGCTNRTENQYFPIPYNEPVGNAPAR